MVSLGGRQRWERDRTAHKRFLTWAYRRSNPRQCCRHLVVLCGALFYSSRQLFLLLSSTTTTTLSFHMMDSVPCQRWITALSAALGHLKLFVGWNHIQRLAIAAICFFYSFVYCLGPLCLFMFYLMSLSFLFNASQHRRPVSKVNLLRYKSVWMSDSIALTRWPGQVSYIKSQTKNHLFIRTSSEKSFASLLRACAWKSIRKTVFEHHVVASVPLFPDGDVASRLSPLHT